MGFDSKCNFIPPTILLELLLCSWTWGISSQSLEHRAAATPVSAVLLGLLCPWTWGIFSQMLPRHAATTPKIYMYILLNMYTLCIFLGFPGSSAGKESGCNAGDPGSITGLGRSAGEGIGYPLQYSWASLVAQLVKNLPPMQETWVWEDPLEKRMATHSSILAWRIPWTVWGSFHGVAKNQTGWSNFHFHIDMCSPFAIVLFKSSTPLHIYINVSKTHPGLFRAVSFTMANMAAI